VARQPELPEALRAAGFRLPARIAPDLPQRKYRIGGEPLPGDFQRLRCG